MSVADASFDPKTLSIMPGAYAGWNDAPFNSAVIAGCADDAAPVTVTVIAAVYVCAESHSAVITPEPCNKADPGTTRVAVAVPPEPDRTADPRERLASLKETLPVGVLPPALVMVAVSVTLPFILRFGGVAMRVMLVVGTIAAIFFPVTALMNA